MCPMTGSSTGTIANWPAPWRKTRPLSAVPLAPCAMTATAGSATSPSGSVVAVARRSQTPGSVVGVSPSRTWRPIRSLRRAVWCTRSVNQHGPPITDTIGRIVQDTGSFDLGAEAVSWCYRDMAKRTMITLGRPAQDYVSALAADTEDKEMTTVNEPRAGPRAAQGRRLGPPNRLTVWLLYSLAALVFLVTMVMIVRSGAAPCTGAASVRAAQHHRPNPACAPAVRSP